MVQRKSEFRKSRKIWLRGKARQKNDDQSKFVFLAFLWTISTHEADFFGDFSSKLI
jgi:hypothetical protein